MIDRLIARITRRAPDCVIGPADAPYLKRWWVIPRNRVFNVYLHNILQEDYGADLHDHPWASCSVILRGGYSEVLNDDSVKDRKAGDVILRRASTAHRIECLDKSGDCWTLFITGPKTREWGFLHKGRWLHNKVLERMGMVSSKEGSCDS